MLHAESWKKDAKLIVLSQIFFGPQDTERFLTIRGLYTVQEKRNLLRDANTTREDKERRLQEWYEAADALVVAQILLDFNNRDG